MPESRIGSSPDITGNRGVGADGIDGGAGAKGCSLGERGGTIGGHLERTSRSAVEDGIVGLVRRDGRTGR